MCGTAVSERMVKLPDGCLVPAERECGICDKITSTLELEWHSVHNHPIWLACPKCRKDMDSWKPLPGPEKSDDLDKVSVKILKPKRSQSLIDMHYKRQQEEKAEAAEAFTFELDTSISLDDLEEQS